MGQIKLMHAKLHRVRVTEANLDYIGSITIDRDLMDKVGILPLEEVDVINLNNGKRWTTYAIPGVAGSGEVCSNGGAALLCQPGDILIIIAYETCDRAKILQYGHQAQVAIADANNRCQKLLRQTLIPDTDSLQFESF
ncbi:aspartate 1-decarboxylase [Myxosarcina sp. GI1]|uniref:aspartate 1-decarboxylase n=1 Tax=Myxosarcina sp. GI1 TaxID=1541065 RepID=UPI0005691A5E|nr:aspartate 1-decarboxylase [Myxosarcina sp. GI1]